MNHRCAVTSVEDVFVLIPGRFQDTYPKNWVRKHSWRGLVPRRPPRDEIAIEVVRRVGIVCRRLEIVCYGWGYV